MDCLCLDEKSNCVMAAPRHGSRHDTGGLIIMVWGPAAFSFQKIRAPSEKEGHRDVGSRDGMSVMTMAAGLKHISYVESLRPEIGRAHV